MDNATMQRYLAETHWAIHQPALEAAVARYQAGEGEPQAARQRSGPAKRGAIGVVPIRGTIRQHGPQDFMDALFGGSGATTDAISAAMRTFAADPDVGTIVLDIDSPGGVVYGVQELGEEIAEIAKETRVVAVANATAFSAAYWIASQASEIVVTPSGEVGSIGVWTMHIDWTKWNEEFGIDVTYISAGKFKVAGNMDEPLSDEARELIQADINRYYAAFVSAVAKGRGVSTTAVRNGFGEGWTVTAKEAKKLGMVDRVATLNETLVRLGAAPESNDNRRMSPAAEIELERERAALDEVTA
jgi:signal peptide peptidase SppA